MSDRTFFSALTFELLSHSVLMFALCERRDSNPYHSNRCRRNSHLTAPLFCYQNINELFVCCAPGWIRTNTHLINSQPLYLVSFKGMFV